MMGNALNLSKEKAVEWIVALEQQGDLKLSARLNRVPSSLEAYRISMDATWFWMIIALSLATTLSVFTINENAVPFVYLRYVLGSIFVLFLLGFSLLKALFPKKEIDCIERTAMSIV